MWWPRMGPPRSHSRVVSSRVLAEKRKVRFSPVDKAAVHVRYTWVWASILPDSRPAGRALSTCTLHKPGGYSIFSSICLHPCQRSLIRYILQIHSHKAHYSSQSRPSGSQSGFRGTLGFHEKHFLSNKFFVTN